MFERLAQVVVRRAWWVIGIWVVAAVVVSALAPKLTATDNEAKFLPNHYESVQAQQLQERAFPQAAPPAAVIVYERSDGAPLSTADSTRVQAVDASLQARHIPAVTAIRTGPPSPNRLIQAAGVQMPPQRSSTDKRDQDAVAALRPALQAAIAGTDLRAGITGQAAVNLDQSKAGNRASAIVGGVTIGLILLLLLIIFRSPVIAIMPIVTIGVVYALAVGVIASATRAFHLKADSSLSEFLIVVLFGVGTDYILFLMFRFRERLRLGDNPKAAMVTSVERVGEAISASAGAVIISFLALTLSSLALFSALGPALAIAVAITLVAGLTLVPAVVSLLGTRVFWPSRAWQHESTSAGYSAIGRSLARRPAVYATASGLLLAILAVFAFGYHGTFNLTASSGSNTESGIWQQRLLKGLPAGTTEPTLVYVRSPTPLASPELVPYRTALAAVHNVGSVSAAQLSPDRRVAAYTVLLSVDPESDAALRTIGPLRTVAHDDAPPGSRAYVGGVSAIYVDINRAVDRDYSVVFPVAAGLILIILGLLLRSLVAPWYLLASVGLGFGATLGATVLVFQHARGQPGLIFILPMFMYLFVVALGTDYNILMVSRLREEARRGKSPREAAAIALRHAGPTIGSAGLILSGTFVSFIFAGGSTLAPLGFAISLGIAVAAFVMAMFLTPSITALIGHAAWWPGHQDEAPHR
ncbi:MAG TPA: MMPL family transporter [Mycobacteriales bacterium]